MEHGRVARPRVRGGSRSAGPAGSPYIVWISSCLVCGRQRPFRARGAPRICGGSRSAGPAGFPYIRFVRSPPIHLSTGQCVGAFCAHPVLSPMFQLNWARSPLPRARTHARHLPPVFPVQRVLFAHCARLSDPFDVCLSVSHFSRQNLFRNLYYFGTFSDIRNVYHGLRVFTAMLLVCSTLSIIIEGRCALSFFFLHLPAISVIVLRGSQ